MLQIININQSAEWDDLVKSFKEYDVYYLNGYVKAFQLHGDGTPLLLYYTHENIRAICVVMKRHISDENLKGTTLENELYYDIITPYGYGGFIFEGGPDDEALKQFREEYIEAMNREHIITGFFRLHPQLNNAHYLNGIFDILRMGPTVEMWLDQPEDIFKRLTSKNRNMVRKAIKSGVEIKYGFDKDLFEIFKVIYDQTMIRDNAAKYYFFHDDFYESLYKDMKDNCKIFYAQYEGEIISMAIILFGNNRVHYHLSGSLPEYRNLAPSNLLLYEVACWGARNGYKTFHLGGGVGACEDNLYKFKYAFNPEGINQFSISKQIYSVEKYNILVEKIKCNPAFNNNSGFFPLYRSV